MNSGKTLLAQLMEFVPWSSFARIVARYCGDARVSVLPSTEHFRIMAYAQLRWLDLRGAIPSFVHISDGKMGDVKVLDMLPIEAGASYITDRGYLDFARLYAMHQGGAFFVTRAKSNFSHTESNALNTAAFLSFNASCVFRIASLQITITAPTTGLLIIAFPPLKQ